MPSVPVEIIFGKKSGIPVAINAELKPLFDQIIALAEGGNHWAELCVRQLGSLSSGHFKKNVFIQANGRLEEFGEYTVILPGCKASFRKNSEGIFHVYALEADLNFAELQSDAKKPGLFNVTKKNKDWVPEFVPDGKVKERKVNVIVVSDQRQRMNDSIKLALDAAEDSKQRPLDMESYGFDLHFTPGKKSIGGFRSLAQASKAETDENLHESAILLAKTMLSARTIKGITWVSERGGSGVLTQAMRILKEGGASFDGAGHRAFFSHVQTNLGNAEQLARHLGFAFESKTHSKDWYNLSEQLGSGLFGGFVNPIKRRRSDEKYTKLNCIKDIGKEAVVWTGTVGSVVAAPAAVKSFGVAAVALGTTLAATTGPGMMFVAAGAAYAAFKAAKPVYKGANAVVKSYFPASGIKK
jgi:hypothetical protein